MEVLFLTSGVYPHYRGGVSTWADNLINKLTDFSFTIVSVVSNPHVELVYEIPSNVKNIFTIPLWGSERPEEYNKTSMLEIIRRASKSNEKSIEHVFSPYYAQFLRQCILGGDDPSSLAFSLYKMHEFFEKHDFYRTMRSESVWNTFRGVIADNIILSKINLYQAINIARTLERYLKVLTFSPPKTDVSHLCIAGVAGIIGVIAKLKHGTPMILTEHGVYYRERMLDLVNQPLEDDMATKIFWTNFFKALVKLNYNYSEVIYPVCEFNRRWEYGLTGNGKSIEVIYNGVDNSRFRPASTPPSEENPTVVAVIRIDRFKDPLTLISAMKYVRDEIPNVRCLIYGPAPDEEYARLVAEHTEKKNLSDTVYFMGYTKKPEEAYVKGHVGVMSSLSEGFPFALIEAMSCGLPIVATDVGGMREALGDVGILVPPRSPRSMADAIIKLLRNKTLREELGKAARQRVLDKFDFENVAKEYRRIYYEYGEKNT